MTIIEIKRFNPIEFNAVRQLLLQLVEEELLPTKEHYIKLIESQNSQLFIAEIDSTQTGRSKIVGTLTAATYKILSGKRMWIEDVVVDSAHRGKGIGQDLILFAINVFKIARSLSLNMCFLLYRDRFILLKYYFVLP